MRTAGLDLAGRPGPHGRDAWAVTVKVAQQLTDHIRMTRLRRGRDALTAVTAIVLLSLGAVSAWAVVSLSSSTAEIARTTERVRAYQDLQEAVASQAFAEAGVRRAPSAAARLRLDAAIDGVGRSVTTLRPVAAAGEGAMLSYLTLLNDRYVAETRRTIDTSATGEPDDRVAGPALDAVQLLVHAAILGNQSDAAAAVERQRRLVGTLAVVLPAVLVIAALALATAVRSSEIRSHQLASTAADAHRRATHDSLTGLANRAGFDEALPALLREASAGTCLLLVDLDHFKRINDTHGHAAGDAVLMAVSVRMRDALRPRDLVARLGGDEFAVLLRHCADPLRAGERLRSAVAQPMSVGEDHTVVVPTVSVGVAVCSGDDRTSLLSRADQALYHAKAMGRDRVSSMG